MTVDMADILKSGESETVEFKESFGEEALESVGAFANSSGGTILIGVRDNGDVCGYSIGKKTLEEVANRIQEVTDPRLQPSIFFLKHDLVNFVLFIRIEPRTGVPVSIRGRYFRRVGRTNQRMGHDEIIRRMQSGRTYWDDVIENRATIHDLSTEKMANFIETVRKNKRQPIPSNTSDLVAITQLQLLRDGQPTRAAMLLFGKELRALYPGASIRLGRFRSETHIVDDKQLDGTLFDQVEEAMSWFREKLATEYVITGKPQRDVIWEYPLEAVREGLVNAVCHRTYTENSQIQVRLYDDRLEIWNSGALIQPLKISDLSIQHQSIPRNPLIAEAFFNANLIEKWGTGTLRMIELMRTSKLPDPIFDTSHQENFRLIFLKAKVVPSDVESGSQELDEKQRQVINLCKKEGRLTNLSYQKHFAVSKRTATRELGVLVEKGYLARQGETGKGTYYVINPGEIKGPKGP